MRGEAQLEGPPDLATLTATVHAVGSRADGVRGELARASGRVRSVLEGAVGVARFSTSGLHVGPEFDQRSGAKITGYRGFVSTTVEVTDFGALSDVVHALAALPQCQIDGPWWSLRSDSPLLRQARMAAVVDARRRAADYAAAVRMAVGELLEISDLEGGGMGGPLRMARALAADTAESQPLFDLEPAVQTVAGQVTMRFALADRAPTRR